jgi:hypothetical protein
MKGVSMNRSLLVLAMFLFAAPAYSMTATVTSSVAPVAAPTAPVTGKTANSATKAATINVAPDTRPGAASAAPSKATTPNAASVTRPAAALSAPGVPMKANAAPSARPGAAPSKASVFMPGPATRPAAVPPSPTKAAWAAVASGSSGMHKGTLEAINVGTGNFQIYGQKLTFNPQRVKVFNRDGKPGSVFGLKNGANIRFTLDATDIQHRRVAVIYVN